MSQEIINKCDLCKKVISHDEVIWTIGILTSSRTQGGKQLKRPLSGLPIGPSSSESNPGKSLESCRKCMIEKFQLIPQEKEDKNTLPPVPTLENLIQDIANEACEEFQN